LDGIDGEVSIQWCAWAGDGATLLAIDAGEVNPDVANPIDEPVAHEWSNAGDSEGLPVGRAEPTVGNDWPRSGIGGAATRESGAASAEDVRRCGRKAVSLVPPTRSIW
jgi:hypothetical protein